MPHVSVFSSYDEPSQTGEANFRAGLDQSIRIQIDVISLATAPRSQAKPEKSSTTTETQP